MRPLHLASLVLLFMQFSLQAAQPSAALLPGNTKLHVSVPDVPKLEAAWKKTKISELFNDPKLKPFLDDLFRESTLAKLGIEFSDLKNLAAGEAAIAVVPIAAGETGHVLIMDAKGRQAAADKVLAKVTASLKKHGYKVGMEVIEGAMVTSFIRPSGDKKSRRDERLFCVYKDETVIAANDDRAIGLILKRLNGKAPDRLSQQKPYQEVAARSKEKTKTPAELFWFAELIGLAEAERINKAPRPRRGPDMLKVLKEEGFTALKGIGGWVSLAQDDFDLIHQTAVYGPVPYQKSMRMIKTTSGTDFTPPSWVPSDIANFSTAYLDLKNAYQFFGSFFDAVYGDGEPGTFDDIIKGLRDDPNGPQIDVGKEVIGRFGQRVTLLAEVEKPINVNSTRTVVAVQTKDEKGLANAIRRLMENDEDVKKHVVAGDTVLWEMITREKKKKKGAKPAPPQPKAPNSAVAVAHGQLFLASDVQLLKVILGKPGKSLASEPDYQRVAATLGKMGAGKDWLRSFSRPDESFYPVYELMRTNQIDKSPSLIAKILVDVLGENVTQLDGSKFPDFQNFRPYLGPSGNFGISAQDGWFITGFALRKK